MPLSSIELVEWTGCATGVAGSLLLASRHAKAGWAFVLFLISNLSWIFYGIMMGALGLVTMQLVFVGTAILGIYTWLVVPRNRRRQKMAAINKNGGRYDRKR